MTSVLVSEGGQFLLSLDTPRGARRPTDGRSLPPAVQPPVTATGHNAPTRVLCASSALEFAGPSTRFRRLSPPENSRPPSERWYLGAGMPEGEQTTPGLDPLSRYEALLRVSRAIAHHRSINELLHAITAQLHIVVPFDYLMLILNDAATDEMRLVVLEPSDTPFAPFVPMPLSDWGPARSAWETQLTTVVPLLTEAPRGHGARLHPSARRTRHLLAAADDGAPARRRPRASAVAMPTGTRPTPWRSWNRWPRTWPSPSTTPSTSTRRSGFRRSCAANATGCVFCSR